ncbi:MAG: NADH-quinone oxidoreductase subunit NuoF [Chloroflexota bacterium]
MGHKYLEKHVLLRHRDIENIESIDVYLANEGYEGLKKAIKEMEPGDVTEAVKAAGLRGRGGAGFPAGLKWSFIPQGIKPVYIAVNADESEPGTFKDREIMSENPHQFIEGVILCAYAVGAETAYIYGRGEFKGPFVKLQKALDEAYEQGYLGKNILGSDFSCDIHLHLGAGAYICGEETALLSSLEGDMGQPRARPPFPAVAGLYAKPTVINNVETLTNVPPIIHHGVDWYRQFGTERSPGTKVFCLSGHVKNPGNYELPLGTPLRFLVEELGGGVPSGKPVKGILPAGAAAPLMPGDKLDTPLDYESVQGAGSMLGSASFIILDADTDIVWAVQKMTHFFKHESCGKCSPCREGTYWLEQVLHRIKDGHGTEDDVDLLTTITDQISGNCFCPLGDFATSCITSSIQHFKDEYMALVEH